jgi:hypothetical protein
MVNIPHSDYSADPRFRFQHEAVILGLRFFLLSLTVSCRLWHCILK